MSNRSPTVCMTLQHLPTLCHVPWTSSYTFIYMCSATVYGNSTQPVPVANTGSCCSSYPSRNSNHTMNTHSFNPPDTNMTSSPLPTSPPYTAVPPAYRTDLFNFSEASLTAIDPTATKAAPRLLPPQAPPFTGHFPVKNAAVPPVGVPPEQCLRNSGSRRAKRALFMDCRSETKSEKKVRMRREKNRRNQQAYRNRCRVRPSIPCDYFGRFFQCRYHLLFLLGT